MVPHDYEVQIAHRSIFTFLCRSRAAPFQVIREDCHLKIVDASIDYLNIVLISETGISSIQSKDTLWLSPVSGWDQNHYASFVKHLNDHPLLCYIWSELIAHLESMPRDYLPSRLDRLSKIKCRVSPENACALMLQTWILEIFSQNCSAVVDSDFRSFLKQWRLQMQASFSWEQLQQPSLEALWEIFWGQSIVAAIEKDCLAAFKVMCHVGVLSCSTRILSICVKEAVKSDRFAILDYLGRIQHSAALGISGALEKSFDDALLLACRAGKDAMVRWLLEVGSLWGWKCEDQGNIGLLVAGKAGHLSVIKVLLDHGMSPNYSGQDGSTPLQAAAIAGHEDVVEILLERGADPNNQDVALRTLLDEATRGRHEAVLKALWRHSKTGPVLSKTDRIVLPFRRNPVFVGRVDILDSLKKCFMTSNFSALVGLGGIG